MFLVGNVLRKLITILSPKTFLELLFASIVVLKRPKENDASYVNGVDKAFKTHITEFQKRNVPVGVYAYVAGKNVQEMEKAAEVFYNASSPYSPSYYWLDVEEKTMSNMNEGVEAFRAKLESLGAKNNRNLRWGLLHGRTQYWYR